MANEAGNDLQKIAMAGLVINICLNILMGFYAFAVIHSESMGNQLGMDSQNVWAEIMTTSPLGGDASINGTIYSNAPENMVCGNNEPNCKKLTSKGSIDQGNFDVIQGAVDLGRLLTFIFTVIGLVIMGPIALTGLLNGYIHNSWLGFGLIFFGLAWQFLTFWLIVRFFLKKG